LYIFIFNFLYIFILTLTFSQTLYMKRRFYYWEREIIN
jgi:hypothetical protein